MVFFVLAPYPEHLPGEFPAILWNIIARKLKTAILAILQDGGCMMGMYDGDV